MTKAFLDPCFTERDRRWSAYLTAAMGLAGALLLLALAAWSRGPY